MLIAALVFGGFGLIIGSFLNVLVLRKGVKSLGGRSHCASCGHLIEWYDNVPVFSWLYLRGRCRHCGSSISAQYPLVEILTATLFGVIGAWFFQYLPILNWTHVLLAFLYLVIVSVLVAITVYDLRHTIIPDEWSYLFAGSALVTFVLTQLETGIQPLQIFLAGPIAALPLFFLWFISGGRWMGFGDPKLALGIGWLLGFPMGLVAVFASFILGSLILVPVLAYERIITHIASYRGTVSGLTMKSEVPFGPFLIASCLILWCFQLFGVPLPIGFLVW